MLFVCLVAYQFINTQKDYRVWREEARALLDEDSDDMPRVKEGIPDGADGTVDLHIDLFLGYVMDNEETRIWAPEIKGRMVCWNGGNWTFTHEVQHTYREDFSLLASFSSSWEQLRSQQPSQAYGLSSCPYKTVSTC
jgi:hypothetical protein